MTELVALLDESPDIAIAGSTMMQLDYPWRINEMGAFIDKGRGTLLFKHHLKKVSSWQGKPLQALLAADVDLSQQLTYCQPSIDVDYVAAASLLIRAPIAKQAGLWMDFFIHFDDVEWCLRIAKLGHRIAVSAKSLIWHVSAMAKVPTWILYYDNRNVLYLLEKHSDKIAIKNTIRWILKKTLYYKLLGKDDLAQLHLQAIADYKQRVTGKKDIQLPFKLNGLAEISNILDNPGIKSIIIPWTVNLQATTLQRFLIKAMRKRPELQVSYIIPPHHLSLPVNYLTQYPLLCQDF